MQNAKEEYVWSWAIVRRFSWQISCIPSIQEKYDAMIKCKRERIKFVRLVGILGNRWLCVAGKRKKCQLSGYEPLDDGRL